MRDFPSPVLFLKAHFSTVPLEQEVTLNQQILYEFKEINSATSICVKSKHILDHILNFLDRGFPKNIPDDGLDERGGDFSISPSIFFINYLQCIPELIPEIFTGSLHLYNKSLQIIKFFWIKIVGAVKAKNRYSVIHEDQSVLKPIKDIYLCWENISYFGVAKMASPPKYKLFLKPQKIHQYTLNTTPNFNPKPITKK